MCSSISKTFTFLVFSFFVFLSCSTEKKAPVNPPTPVISISLSFEKTGNAMTDPFSVYATVLKDNASYTSANLSIQTDKGSISAVTETAPGIYKAIVTPASTGEYHITATCNDTVLKRTALVLKNVHSDWGQPLSVPGDFVNTEGFEDGAVITPDGEWLFVQYSPAYFSGIFVYSAYSTYTHPWVKNIIGPYTQPQRPNFFDARIINDKIDHHYYLPVPEGSTYDTDDGVTDGLQTKVQFVMPTIFYGFKRQQDGTFTQPFIVAVNDDKRAQLNPFGLSFRMNGGTSATAIFSFYDPYSPISNYTDGLDVVTVDLTLGVDNLIGDYTVYPQSFSPMVTVLKEANNQGNPHLYCDSSNNIKSIWTDAEFGDQFLYAYILTSGTLQSGSWTKVQLPSVINNGLEATQPFFTGSELYFRRDSKILISKFLGTHDDINIANNANWSSVETILEATSSTTVGEIVTVGEPTIATINGKQYLYFVYGVVRASTDPIYASFSDINLNVGFVEKK